MRGSDVAAAPMAAAARRTNMSIARRAVGIAGSRATLDLPHVGRAGDGGEPGAMPHPVGQLLDGDPVGGKAEQDARIDRPGARGHHQPFVWREAHRRVHRATTVDRRDRATGAEVRDDERQIVA